MKPRRKRKPLTLRIYPHVDWKARRSSLYVRVLVWPTRRAMIAHGQRCGMPCVRRVLGFCVEVDVRRYTESGTRKRPIVAEVNMYRRRLTTDVIVHELLHATFAWARRTGLPITQVEKGEEMTPEEERLCYVHDSLVRQFVDRATALGVYG